MRKLKLDNLNLVQLTGEVLGKGNKYAPITFSQKTGEHLEAFLAVRRATFPGRKYAYIFTAYNHTSEKKFSGQSLNRLVKLIGQKA